MKKVNKETPPFAQFKVMHQIDYEHVEKLEAKLGYSLRECILGA
jgi:hypothetical protein